MVQRPVLQQVVEEGNSQFELIYKWGCDGSGGHSEYKQKFNSDDETTSDECIVLYSIVPLQLRFGINKESLCMVWQNNASGSPRFCRPIKFMFKKETVDLIKTETQLILDQITSLKPTILNIGGKEISIVHKLYLTMVDGKVCNALTGTKSTQRCYICGATPKSMNNLKQIFPENVIPNYSFGLSPLHALIRSFECLIHIAYRLDIQKWRVTKYNTNENIIGDDDHDEEEKSESDRQIMIKRKKEIQYQFKTQLGLNVDKPKQGFGCTNDGNTARCFFRNAEISSKITGIDETLIKKLGVILQVVSSGYEINFDKFKTYVSETRALYLDLYPWYPMPVTVHKLLCHGPDIVKHHLIPIGMLTEESQEACNKHLRNIRLHLTQKKSRTSTNQDLFNFLMMSSDPIIASSRQPTSKKATSFEPEVLKMLQCTLPDPSLSMSKLSLDNTGDNEIVVE